jgi:hypothetical protein
MKCINKNNFWKLLVFACPGLTAVTGLAEEGPRVTPYRPTVSTPADLPVPGWLEMEAGGLRVRNRDGSTGDTIPYLLKYAFTQDWGVLLGGNLLARNIDAAGDRLSGIGDTNLELKHRMAVDENHAFGIELGFKEPTAKTGLGTGKRDYLINGIYSADFQPWHMDLNLGGTRLGAVADVEGRWQTQWAASLSRSLVERWGAEMEFSGTRQNNIPSTSQFLAALSYASGNRVVWDAGMAKGLNTASQNWSVFAGVSILLERVH